MSQTLNDYNNLSDGQFGESFRTDICSKESQDSFATDIYSKDSQETLCTEMNSLKILKFDFNQFLIFLHCKSDSKTLHPYIYRKIIIKDDLFIVILSQVNSSK